MYLILGLHYGNKPTSFSNNYIWRPSKIPALMFLNASLRNFAQRYLKHSPSLSKALTNCFINPNINLTLLSNGAVYMFFFKKQTFLYLSFSIYPVVLRCSAIPQVHKHKKQGYLLLPRCCSRNVNNACK